jgi:hypothetical protein
MASATNSLPVPDSPQIKTVESVSATLPIILNTSIMAPLLPTMRPAARLEPASTRARS